MKMGRVLLNLSGLLAIVLITSSASGQGVPRNLDALLNMQGQPTADQAGQIERYTAHWLGQLGSDDVDEVASGATALLAPPNNQLATAVFRLAYSKAVLPGLERIVDEGNIYQSVQAMKVVSFLGSRDAMEVAVRRMNLTNESRWKVRLWAAKGAKILLAQLQRDNERQANIDSWLRAIGRAADLEDQWVVLLRDFEALASVRSTVGREEQIRTLKVAVERMSRDQDPSELMFAVCRVIDSLLLQYIDPGLTVQEQRKFGKDLAEHLANVYAVAQKHWDEARRAEQANKAYERAINGSDRLLQLIDANLQTTAGTNPPALRPAWTAGNRTQFESGAASWGVRVRNPPYSG